jgi:acid phosphatase
MGKRQHHMMGGEMRRRYMVQNQLLDLSQYRPSDIYVRSTDYNRTIESALSQLYALYPTGRSI